MRDETKAPRQAAIEDAAAELFAEKGFQGTSMLAIAKRAKASNETLYRWYGDKVGLFRALVERNAAEVRTRLEADLTEDRSAAEALRDLGPTLLSLLLSERAIALNRAAAADISGALGAALTEAGRGSVAPLIARLMLRGRAEGWLTFEDPAEAVALYLSLLVGDLQIRRAIGALPEPDARDINERAARAFAQFCRLAGPITDGDADRRIVE